MLIALKNFYAFLAPFFLGLIWISSDEYILEKETDKEDINVYEGTINGNLAIKLILKRKDSSLTGMYFYQSQGIDIVFSGSVNKESNSIVLDERDSQGNKTAIIKCKFINGQIAGTWENIVTKKKFPVTLKKSSFVYRALPANMEGNYFLINDNPQGDKGCKVEIRLFKSDGKYVAKIFSGTKLRTQGRIKFTRLSGENYIDFVEKGNTYPSILLNEGSMDFQNYGNAGNSYLHFKECDSKYLHLEKEI